MEINGKQRIIIPIKGEHVKLKNYWGKIKSPFMQILKVYYCQKIIGRKNPEESHTTIYQKHACSCGYKLLRVDDTF